MFVSRPLYPVEAPSVLPSVLALAGLALVIGVFTGIIMAAL